MNTVIFLTQANKHEMAESIRRLADKQQEKVNGALIVCHQSAVSVKEAQRIAAPLSSKFATGGLIQTASNLNMSHDGQISVMLARFVALAYVKFPGPWLIIDAPTESNVDNWAAAALKQHRVNGGRVVGMGKEDGKSVLTYGPVTVQLASKTMKMLHFATGESWRSRCRFLLMNSGLKTVAPEDAVFTSELSQSRPALTPEKLEELKKDVVALHTPDVQITSAQTEEFERASLMKAVEKATGKRPHHFTGIDKLRQMIQEIEQPA